MNEKITFRMARPADAGAVLALYRAAIGTPGCTWTLDYPSDVNVAEDIVSRSLYCLCRGDEFIGAGFIGRNGDADDLDALAPPAVNWTPCRLPCELARICVSPDWQGRGIGGELVRNLMTSGRGRGYDYVRLLVSVGNARAQAMYARAGFKCCGSARMYGGEYLCMEARLSYFAPPAVKL